MDPITASAVLHNEAVAHVREGRHEKARELLVAAVRLAGEDAVDVRTLKLLWQCAAAIGDHATATAAGVKAAQRDALDFAFSDRLLKSIRACPLPSRESQRLPAQLPT